MLLHVYPIHFKKLIIIYFKTIDKQALQVIFISLVVTDVSARRSLVLEESTRREPTCPLNPITYNLCRSHGSNSGRSDDKRVHSPLRYSDTPILIKSFFFLNHGYFWITEMSITKRSAFFTTYYIYNSIFRPEVRKCNAILL